ncbi:hypothetical protein ACTFIN_01565 [Clostridium cagae]|uniref:hypothetical protein n=1 Tax=Clostridium cagae TaxID=2080751 RepID=UPI003F763061
MKLKLKTTGLTTAQILLDGYDISNKLTGLDIKIRGCEIPKVTLEIVPDDIEIDGDFEVLKKVKDINKENKNYFNLTVNKVDCDVEEIMEQISKRLEKAYRSRLML